MFSYQRICVIGCSGAGKTTFSKQLAEITGLPLYHLDNIYWLHDASHIKRNEFIKKQRQIMKNDKWIIDGNYRGTIKYRIPKSDIVFFFDIPVDVCIEGVLKRDRIRDDVACELEPNEELIDDIKSYPTVTRPEVFRLFRKNAEVKVIIFTSRKEADNYLSELRREYGFNI